MTKGIKLLFAAMLAVVVAVSGCSSKTTANEKNFKAAINKYYEERGRLCINVGKMPFEERESGLVFLSGSTVATYKPLEKIGLVSIERFEIESDLPNPYTDKRRLTPIRMVRFSLTDKAKPFVREAEKKEGEYLLCYADKIEVDTIGKWVMGKDGFAQVRYTYKLKNLADWAKNKDAQDGLAYRLRQVVDGAENHEEKKCNLILTNEDWEAKCWG